MAKTLENIIREEDSTASRCRQPSCRPKRLCIKLATGPKSASLEAVKELVGPTQVVERPSDEVEINPL